jgi:DnaK suppressor protein
LKIEAVADALDQVISSTERELAVTRLESAARLLRDIRSALARIDKATYGFCEACEEPIPDKRLDAVPWAPLCIRCQEQAEARSQAQEIDLGEAA